MAGIIDRATGASRIETAVRCPYCAVEVTASHHCKHVRWTFDQGDPLDFTRFAMETSPYVRARGRKVSDISSYWWDEHGQWVVDHVVTMFHCADGFVFGDLALLDVLTRDVWKRFDPDPVRPQQLRYDP
jgi:hypothetical protein